MSVQNAISEVKLDRSWLEVTDRQSGLTIWGRGYVFGTACYVNGLSLVDEILRLVCDLDETDAVNTLEGRVPEFNGAWALVVRWRCGRLFTAVDRCRSIPLFYTLDRCGLTISSSIYPLLKHQTDTQLDEGAALDFMLTGYVTGSETLKRGIYKLRAGELLHYDPGDAKNNLKLARYFRFLPTPTEYGNEHRLQAQLVDLFDSVFARFCDAIRGKPILVPLSGGLDSRLIAAMLKRHGAENVTCFSYGRPGNTEARISKRVADVLGYPWRFVAQDECSWKSDLADPEMLSYWSFCSQFTSLPHFQDWPAVRALLSDGFNPADVVFVPGHSGDFLAGRHIPLELYRRGSRATLENAASLIVKRHYTLWPIASDSSPGKLLDAARQRIIENLRLLEKDLHPSPLALFEAWDFQNRQALFIVNSLRVYEFFGTSWSIPLWDYDLTDFFLKVPPRQRRHRRLFVKTLFESVFTGELAGLREIPVANWGHWKKLIPPPGRELAIRLFHRLGILDQVRKMKQKTNTSNPLAFDAWFSSGRDPAQVSVRHALSRYHIEENLPEPLLQILAPHWDRPSSKVTWNGLLAAAYLGLI